MVKSTKMVVWRAEVPYSPNNLSITKLSPRLLFGTYFKLGCVHGSVAQWIRRLPTEQEIVGSSPT